MTESYRWLWKVTGKLPAFTQLDRLHNTSAQDKIKSENMKRGLIIRILLFSVWLYVVLIVTQHIIVERLSVDNIL